MGNQGELSVICPICQAENRAGARFCAACGNPLPEAEPSVLMEPEAGDESPAVAVKAESDALPEHAGQVDQAGEPENPPAFSAQDQDTVDAGLGDSPRESDLRAKLQAPEPLTEDHSPSEDVGQDVAEAIAGDSDQANGVEEGSDEGLAPLPAGTLLADRYEIVELVSAEPEGNLYAALDLARCPICGFDGNTPADEFCADCGAALSAPPACHIREQPEHVEPEALARFNADGRAYVVLPAEPELVEPARPQQIQLRWAAATDPGQVRELNEDFVDAHVYAAQGGPTLGLFVVADGVGGQAAGEVASKLATQVIWENISETVWLPELKREGVLPETMETRVEEAIQAANQAVYGQQTEQANDMGTTVTLALLRDNIAIIANVGDSRTYLWNAGGLRQLTVDHSLVQSLIEAGKLEPEGIYTHPQRNVIYRSIGDRPRIEIDTFVHDLAPGDRLILCSDGLWEMARDEGIEEILLREPDLQMACDALVERANLAGGTDNISVIIVHLSGT